MRWDRRVNKTERLGIHLNIALAFYNSTLAPEKAREPVWMAFLSQNTGGNLDFL